MSALNSGQPQPRTGAAEPLLPPAQQRMPRDLALQLLPRLAGVPLPIYSAAGAPVMLGLALEPARVVTIAGTPFVTWLALLQCAAALGECIPTPVSIADLDDGIAPPADLLAAWERGLDDVSLAGRVRAALGFLRSAPKPERLVLAHGLAALPPERRRSWVEALPALGQTHPEWRIAIALAPGDPPPAGALALWIDEGAAALSDAWVARLLPQTLHEAARQALAPQGALAASAHSAIELMMLAAVAPESGLPPSREHLYRAFADLLDRTPAAPGDTGRKLVEAQLRRYHSARALVDDQQFEKLRRAADAERPALAALAATLLADPTPVYDALWNAGDPDTITLAYCLLFCPPPGPLWPIRIAFELAAAAPGDAAAALLLERIEKPLDAALVAAVAMPHPPVHHLTRLFGVLPVETVLPHLNTLAYAARTPHDLGWRCADLLIERAAPPHEPPQAHGEPLVRWAYVQALGASEARQQLEAPYARAALRGIAAAGGASRAARALARLLDDEACSLSLRMQALEMLAAGAEPDSAPVLAHALVAPERELRDAAYSALMRIDAPRAVATLKRNAAAPALSWELRLEAYERLAGEAPAALPELLLQLAGDGAVPLHARLQLAATARRPECAAALLQIARAPAYHPEVRAAAARACCAGGSYEAIRTLLRMLRDPQTPRAIRAAICNGLDAAEAIEPPERTAAARRLVARTLVLLLGKWQLDSELTIAAIRVLGRYGGLRATALLARLAGIEARTRLFDSLPFDPRAQRPDPDDPQIPASLAQRLLQVIIESATPADRPTTLAEMLNAEADRVRAAAAEALATIDRTAARAALRLALAEGATVGSAIAFSNAYIAAGADDEALASALADDAIDPMVRWRLVRAASGHGRSGALLGAFVRPELDPFIRGAIVEAFGESTDNNALRELARLAHDAQAGGALRMQAISALGRLDEPAVESVLAPLIENPALDATLRGRAAACLPRRPGARAQQALQQIVQSPAAPAPLLIGALETLARAPDRTLLPALLRACMDIRDEVVTAAIGALAAVRDPVILPTLTRIAIDDQRAVATRIRAAGALAQLGDDEGLLLLRWILETAALPLQLQALEYLAAAGSAADMLAILVDRQRPTPLRMRALNNLPGDERAHAALMAVIVDREESLQMRGAATRALAGANARPAALMPIIADGQEAAEIRVRCIELLRDQMPPLLPLLLSRLAEEATEAPAVRAWALTAIGGTGLIDPYREREAA
jgi:hypothetical protein